MILSNDNSSGILVRRAGFVSSTLWISLATSASVSIVLVSLVLLLLEDQCSTAGETSGRKLRVVQSESEFDELCPCKELGTLKKTDQVAF